jgi:hypothetical protein
MARVLLATRRVEDIGPLHRKESAAWASGAGISRRDARRTNICPDVTGNAGSFPRLRFREIPDISDVLPHRRLGQKPRPD